jgi:hypothetical protein
MGEVGCLRDGCFHNLQAEGLTILESVSLDGGFRLPVESLTDDRIVLLYDSGKTFICDGGVGRTITLPSVATAGKGFNCRVIIGSNFGGHDWTIKATATDFVGGINEVEVDESLDCPSTTGADNITFELAAETIGDYVDIVCSGQKMFVRGQSQKKAAITFS